MTTKTASMSQLSTSPHDPPSDGATRSTTAAHSGHATFPSPTPPASLPSITLPARHLLHPVEAPTPVCPKHDVHHRPRAQRPRRPFPIAHAAPVTRTVTTIHSSSHAQLLDIRLSGHDHLRAIACPSPPVEATTPACLRHDAHCQRRAQRARQQFPIVHAASVAPSGTTTTLRAPTPCYSTSPPACITTRVHTAILPPRPSMCALSIMERLRR
ncbi:hypothetical protein K438DRAFT_1991408 [Mycena galopus ATCC 62051]|nr:hypothetical protein K438DRAFT_1991408 [Mycena galopus ATCC 62051]